MTKGRYKKAFEALTRFRGTEIQAARELYFIHAQIEQEELLVKESAVASNGNIVTRMIELFTIPRIRRATQASGIVMIAQQMCGSRCTPTISSCTLVILRSL